MKFAVKQRQFEAAHELHWVAFAEALDRHAALSRQRAEQPRGAGHAASETSLGDSLPAFGNVQPAIVGVQPAPTRAEFLRLYRMLCRDLALAETRGYSPGLVDRLNGLAIRGHNLLYTSRSGFVSQMRAFLLRDFPRLVRAEWRLVLLSAALFVLPGAALSLATVFEPSSVYFVLSPAAAHKYEEMYTPGQNLVGAGRSAGNDFAMFGFYIRNNIGIGFQCFASGILLGIGPVFYLVFNSLQIGGAAAHLAVNGYGGTFFPFVIGHGAFELTAIVLSGAAGLKLGMALLRPGRARRGDALIAHGRIAVRIVYGVFIMLLIAAFLEAFWSARTLIPAWTRYIVGAALWTLVSAYFVYAGRGGEAAGNARTDGGTTE